MRTHAIFLAAVTSLAALNSPAFAQNAAKSAGNAGGGGGGSGGGTGRSTPAAPANNGGGNSGGSNAGNSGGGAANNARAGKGPAGEAGRANTDTSRQQQPTQANNATNDAPGKGKNADDTTRDGKSRTNAATDADRRNQSRRQAIYPWSDYYGDGYWSTPTYGNGSYENRGTSTNERAYRSDWDSTPSANDLPSSLNATSRAEAETARAAMMESRARLEKDFRASQAFVDASKEAKDAQAQYDEAVRKARGNLKQSSDYQQAVAEKGEAQQRVEAVQAVQKIGPTTAPAGDSFSPTAVRAAQAKLNAATEVTQLERDEFRQDPEVRQARERMDAAITRLNQLKREFDATLANDSQFQSAQQRLDAAVSGASR